MNEQDYLQQYNAAEFPIPLVTVDLVVMTLRQQRLEVLLTQRNTHPFQHQWALPGGFVDLQQDRDLLATAERKLQEKTGLCDVYLEQVASVGNAERDPRGWSTTVVHMALTEADRGHHGVDPSRLQWVALDQLPPLAFDHTLLIDLARQRLHSRTLYTSLPAFLIPEPFSLRQLQSAYEAVLGQPLTTKAFRTRMQASDAIHPTDQFQTGTGRPARLYRRHPQPFIFKRSLENALPNLHRHTAQNPSATSNR